MMQPEINQSLLELNDTLAKLLVEAINIICPSECINQREKIKPEPIMCEFDIGVGYSLDGNFNYADSFMKGIDIEDAFQSFKKQFKEQYVIDLSMYRPYTIALTNVKIPVLYELRK
jgi:hypothetical protein